MIELESITQQNEKKSLDAGMRWLRDEAETLTDPRQISKSILALIVGGDPKYAHHIQRFAKTLRLSQNTDESSPYFGSWGGNFQDTASALLSLKTAAFDDSNLLNVPYMKRGLKFLKEGRDTFLGNWHADISETLACSKLILEVNDIEQLSFVTSALSWVTSLQNEDGGIINTNYTSQTVLVLLTAHNLEEWNQFVQKIDIGVQYLMKNARNSFSNDLQLVSQTILAIMEGKPQARLKDETIQKGIDFLLGKQNENGSWNNDIYKTTNCILAISKKLGPKVILDRFENYWLYSKPVPASFNWTSESILKDDEISVKGKLLKAIREGGAPITVGEFPSEQVYFKNVLEDIHDKLDLASRAKLNWSRQRGKQDVDETQLQQNILTHISNMGTDLHIQFFGQGDKKNQLEKKLSDNQIDHIVIESPPPLDVIPWELFYDGEDFYCLKYSLGRRISSDPIINESQNEKIKALLIGDPSGTLTGTDPEINEIEKILKKFAQVDCFIGIRNAREFKTEFLKYLRTGNYDIIHFAGHADCEHNRSFLRFSEEIKVGAEQIARFMSYCRVKPKVVFFNACSSAAYNTVENEDDYKFDKKFAVMATNFVHLLAGEAKVPAFIGSIVPIHDEPAAYFAKVFYNYLRAGCSVGDAIRIARIESYLKNPYDFTWASFILYGDPDTKLLQLMKRN